MIKTKSEGKLLKGTAFLSLSTLLVKLLGVIYKIPLASYLGDEGMGYFNSAYTVYSFFYLVCTAGVPKAVMILESKKGSDGEHRRIFYALFCFGAFGALASLLLIVLSGTLSVGVGSPLAKYTLLSIAPSILFVSLGGVLRGKLSSQLRFGQIAVGQLIEALGRLLFGLYFARVATRLVFSLPLVSSFTILGVTLGAFFSYIYMYICYKSKLSKEKAGQKIVFDLKYCKENLKEILKISIPITLSSAVMSATSLIDLTLIMRNLHTLGYSEAEATALYGNYTTLAVPMFNLGVSLITPIALAFVPMFSKKSSEGLTFELTKTVNKTLSLVNMVSVPISMGLFVYSSEILTLLFKGSDIHLGSTLLKTLTPAIFLMGLLLTVNSLLEATSYSKIPVYSMLVGSVCKVIAEIILLKDNRFGITAAPIGTVICYTVALIVSTIILGKKTKIYPSIIGRSILPLIYSILAIFITKPLYNFLYITFGNTIALLITIFAVMVIYSILSLISILLIDKNLLNKAKRTKFA